MDVQQITYDICRGYLRDRCDTLPTHVYDLILGKLRAREFSWLAASVTNSGLEISCPETMRTLMQIEAFFKKNASFTEPVCARLAALLSFEEGEQLCEITNQRLDEYSANRSGFPTDISVYVERAQRYIRNALGDHRKFLEKLPELLEVTSGATVSRPRRMAQPFLKLSRRIEATPGAVPYLALLADYFGYDVFRGRLFTWNRVEFVPKSWKTERTIACEPAGNMALQLAFDKYAKVCLRRKGINLSDQTRNQELAKEGSLHDQLATIDLSMASDTLAYNTVALLLPWEWFHFLRAIRSQKYALYHDKEADYHKFSSMGNGATFALETLVFAAACYAVGSRTCSVYGDDIVIEQDLVQPLIAFLSFLGFVVNTEKSFTCGPFRESCGTNWFKGIDVTPQYIREVDARKATMCHLVNTMAHISEPFGFLSAYLCRFSKQHKLPLVPYNEDSMSGVWIDSHSAYRLKLIRTRFWIPKFKGYKVKSHNRRNQDIRSLFLWHLGASRLKNRKDPYESSWYSISSHKYVRKWVYWKIPVVGAPVKLYYFTDELLREESGE